MAAPGTETILEDLFKHDGVHSRRYNVSIQLQPWGQLAARILMAGLGTPLGYVDRSGQIITNPVASEDVDGEGLFIMVNHDRIPEHQQMQDVVSNVS
jgi:voltage-gated potassium channel